MSSQRPDVAPRISARQISQRKGGEPIVCLTAYTAPVAELLDDVCDLLLVGDSVGMVLHGLPNTVGVTMEMMILHAQAVMRTSRRALVVVDMPFGSYESAKDVAYANAARILKETGAQAVKVESGPHVAETIAYLTRRGIPVMGHVGLRPQSVLVDGGFPYFVATLDGRVVGYAYAGAYRPRPAYRFTVENSVYLEPAIHRRGIGLQLLQRLIAESEARGYRQMIAVIGDSANAGSIGVHTKCGFQMIGTHPDVGFKFGRWLDGVLMQRALGPGDTAPPITGG